MESRAVRVEHPRFAPCADEPEEGPIVYALPHHVQQPPLVSMVTVACDIGFHHLTRRATLPVTCEVSDRLSCPHLLPGAIATCKKVLRVDSVQYPRDRRLEACVRCGGDAQRAQGALTLRDGVPSNQCGSGALRLHSRHEGGDMVMPTCPLGSCTEAVSPRCRTLLEERPAAEHLGHWQPTKEMTKAVGLVVGSFRRYALQGGWHGLLPSFMPGPCFLCRLHPAVSPFLPTSHFLSRSTVSCSDSLEVFSRPPCGRIGFPTPYGAQAPPGSPTFSTLLSLHATP